MLQNRIIRNTLIYFLLMVGYLFVYLLGVEKQMYKVEEQESKSKVNFIYQQF